MHHLQRNTGARVRQVFVPADQPPSSAQPPAPLRGVPAQPIPTVLAAGTQAVKSTGLPSEAQSTEQPADERPSDQGISRSDLVRGFEYEKGKYVEFEPDELQNIAPRTSDDMQIVEFVRFEEVDPVYLETSYYVAPDRAGEKAYALLFEALKTTGFAAIAEFVMQRRNQTMILRPGSEGMIAHTMFYADEVRRENEFHADSRLIVPQEMDLAVKLVEALAAKFEPEKFKDKYREKLQAAISAKVEAGAVREVFTPTLKSPAVVDIMAALTESLARTRKPVASEGKAARVSAMEKKKGVGRKNRA